MTTNITQSHRHAFQAMLSGEYDNFALFSCFVNGAPAAAIVAVNRDGEQYTFSTSRQRRRSALRSHRP